MPRHPRIEFPGAFYHVFSRGNEKKAIFWNDDDFHLFLATLEESAKRYEVVIHSYCLMTNHYHLLIETKKANLSNFMKRLLGVYTIRFNRIHKRVGHLFQGRYKPHLIDKDAYLLEVSRYIHLNPVKAGMSELPEGYRWSSMRYFLGETNPPPFLNTDEILAHFPSKNAYRSFVHEGIKSLPPDPIKKARGPLLGSDEFVQEWKAKLAEEGDFDRKRELLEVPLDYLQEVLEEEEDTIKIYSFWKYGKRKQKEIGALFQKTDSAVSHIIKRVEKTMIQDTRLKNKADAIERAISCFKD